MERFEIGKGESSHIAFVRIFKGADLIPAIKKAFLESGFLTAQISGAIGSMESVNYTFIGEGGKYRLPIVKEGFFELLCASGFISVASGDVEFHIHAVFADKNGAVFGGHLLANGNIVCATCELTLTEIKGVAIRKEFDEESGFNLFKLKRFYKE